MYRIMSSLWLLAFVVLVATPNAKAKIVAEKNQASLTIYTYYGTEVGYGADSSEAASDAHDQVWDTVFWIGVTTGYTLVELRIINEGPYDPVTGSYTVTFEADFWDGGNFKRSPIPIGF